MNPAEEHLAFFHELGFAIAQWAQLEMSLFWCLSTCFPQDQWETIYARHDVRCRLQAEP